ncbi:MAG: hypothetical protein QXD57_07555 [Ignisphaera sp.]
MSFQIVSKSKEEVVQQEFSKEMPIKHYRIDVKPGTTNFTPNGVKALIKHYYSVLANSSYPSFPSLILIGPPGVGKSTAVKEAAAELAKLLGKKFIDITKKENRHKILKLIDNCLNKPNEQDERMCLDSLGYFVFLDLRLTEVEPSDLIGIPYRVGADLETSKMEYSPPTWAVIFHYFPGILFLDELSNINRPDVMSVAYKLLIDRAAGFVNFNPNVMVIAAGNLPEHAPGIAQSLPPPVVNRSSIVYVDAPSIDEWYEWMVDVLSEVYKNNTNLLNDYMETLNIVYAFLYNYPEYFISFKYDPRSNENFPTPRSWSHLVFTTPASLLKSLSARSDVILAILASFIGNEAANEFLPILKESIIIKVDDIINKPELIIELIDKAGDDRSMINRIVSLIGLLVSKLMRDIDKIPTDKIIKIIDNIKTAGDKIRPGLGCSAVQAIFTSINLSMMKSLPKRPFIPRPGEESPLSKLSKIGEHVFNICKSR